MVPGYETAAGSAPLSRLLGCFLGDLLGWAYLVQEGVLVVAGAAADLGRIIRGIKGDDDVVSQPLALDTKVVNIIT